MIYLDNVATTKILPEVIESMIPYLTDQYGNPSSIYKLGQDSKTAINNVRKIIADAIGAEETEIFFTSCGTESNNWAIKGSAELGKKDKRNHIITTQFEHHAVLHTVEYLAENGFEVTYLPVYEDGIVKIQDVEAEIRDNTCVVSIMYANNEIGTIQPISEIGEICKQKGILFHTDAVQALGILKMDVNKLNVDMLSMSAHKLHASKGIGALYIRSGIKIPNLLHGGGQEFLRRAGTENVASIVGFGKAVECAMSKMDKKIANVSKLRDKLIDFVLKNIPKARLNGSKNNRLPGNVNFSFEGLEGESLILLLQEHGIYASTGSACTSGSLNPSHVLLSIGLSHEIAHGSLRLTISDLNTEDEIDKVIEVLPQVISRLRSMSPIWNDELIDYVAKQHAKS